MFRFVTRKLRWLASIPCLPQVFEAMLVIGSALFAREKLRAMELLEQFALAEPDVRKWPHRLGGTGFFVGNCEIGHLHGNGLFDALVGGQTRKVLVSKGEALAHHVYADSGWISFWIKSEEDAWHALNLMRVAKTYRMTWAS